MGILLTLLLLYSCMPAMHVRYSSWKGAVVAAFALLYKVAVACFSGPSACPGAPWDSLQKVPVQLLHRDIYNFRSFCERCHWLP